jgi:hypothetical protein
LCVRLSFIYRSIHLSSIAWLADKAFGLDKPFYPARLDPICTRNHYRLRLRSNTRGESKMNQTNEYAQEHWAQISLRSANRQEVAKVILELSALARKLQGLSWSIADSSKLQNAELAGWKAYMESLKQGTHWTKAYRSSRQAYEDSLKRQEQEADSLLFTREAIV